MNAKYLRIRKMKSILSLITIVLCANLSVQDFDQQKMNRLPKRIESNQKEMGNISIEPNICSTVPIK